MIRFEKWLEKMGWKGYLVGGLLGVVLSVILESLGIRFFIPSLAVLACLVVTYCVLRLRKVNTKGGV